MQPLPHAGLVPVPQPSPARHARPEAEVLRQVLPLDPRMQHVQDPAQHIPVRQRPAAGIPEPALTLRQQRFHAVPQLIRHDPRRRPHTRPNAQLPHQSRQPGTTHRFVLAVVIALSSPARTPTHPHQPLPASIRPGSLTKIEKVTQRRTQPPSTSAWPASTWTTCWRCTTTWWTAAAAFPSWPRQPGTGGRGASSRRNCCSPAVSATCGRQDRWRRTSWPGSPGP